MCVQQWTVQYRYLSQGVQGVWLDLEHVRNVRHDEHVLAEEAEVVDAVVEDASGRTGLLEEGRESERG